MLRLSKHVFAFIDNPYQGGARRGWKGRGNSTSPFPLLGKDGVYWPKRIARAEACRNHVVDGKHLSGGDAACPTARPISPQETRPETGERSVVRDHWSAPNGSRISRARLSCAAAACACSAVLGDVFVERLRGLLVSGGTPACREACPRR